MTHVICTNVRAKKLSPSLLPALAAAFALACFGDNGTTLEPPPHGSQTLTVLGTGQLADRFTGELWVQGNTAYTTTWGHRPTPGNAVNIWDVSGNVPTLVDSLIIPTAVTLGDVQVSDDGQTLVVATEFSPGSIVLYSLANPRKPQLVTHYSTALTDPGVHTADVARVNGRLYAFLCVDNNSTTAARLVIVDITNPATPTQVFTQVMGSPYVHDTFVRDGVLFIAVWNDGIKIWDIGGGGRGGTPSSPVELSTLATLGGKAHNIRWYKDAGGAKRFAFGGEEGPGSVASSSSGDIHVIDVADLTAPHEVAFYHIDGAGTHNFWVDESRGILYAAYYNGGVRAIDVKGDLSTCDPSDRDFLGRCDLGEMEREVGHGLLDGPPVYIWGVQLAGGQLYASDMLNGIWKLSPVP